MRFLKHDYVLVEFKKSRDPSKKYDAVIKNQKTDKTHIISFGSKVHQHYRDVTPLKLYRDLDHNDTKRRENFRKRFRKLYNPDYYSPTQMSWEYLW